jgi:FtsP/CotA-like multicopper oxidase with cupredoxin domain
MLKYFYVAALVVFLSFTGQKSAEAVPCGGIYGTCIESAVIINSGTGTTPVTAYGPATGNGAELDAMYCTSNESFGNAQVIISILHSSTSYALFNTYVSGGSYIVTNAGIINSLFATFSGTPPSGVPVDQFGNPMIKVASGDALQIALGTGLSAGQTITCTTMGVQH